MGIQGLSTFVDENPHLLTDHRLHNTRVIIDGNNLYFFLCQYYRVSCAYAGDYDHYAHAVENYFSTLLSVKIQPFVIFDGCYNADNRKLSTLLKRARDKIKTSAEMSKGGYGKLIPLLAAEVFRDVLVKLEIPHVMSDGEADGQVAALANIYGCPVMSNDSDFYIFDLPGGFILFDYLNMQVRSATDESGNKYNYLHAQIYYLNNLLNSYKNLDKTSIPLFATLMGNDFVEAKHFETFFSKANISRGRQQVSGRRHYKMSQLLHWMNNNKGNIISKVLCTLPADKQDQVRELIELSVENYTHIMLEFGENDPFATKIETNWRTYDGNVFPDWFTCHCRQMKLFPFLLNALVLRRVILPCQVEVSSLPSSMDCCKHIRQIVYSILLSVDASDQLNDQDITVIEYTRNGSNLVKTEVPLLAEIPNGKKILSLQDLPFLDAIERETFFFDCLDTHKLDGSENLSCDIKFFIYIVRYFILNVEPSVSRNFIYSLVMSIVKLTVCSSENNLVENNSLHVKNIQRVNERLKKYMTVPRHNNARLFKGKIVHSLSQLQACWWSAAQLHHVLLLPQTSCSPTVLNGTFIYSLLSDLQSRTDPRLFISELLGRDSALNTHYETILNCILQALPHDAFYTQVHSVKKPKKSKKAKSVKAFESSQNDTLAEAFNIEANCELINRFSPFMIDH